MKKLTVDLSRIPDFSHCTSPEATVVSHVEMGPVVELCLGDDDVLRINGIPTSLYRRHDQGQNRDSLVLGELEVEATKMHILNGTLAEILFCQQEMIPHHWLQQATRGGFIFLGHKSEDYQWH